MYIGCCTSSISHAALIAASTLDYVEEHVQNFLVPDRPDGVFLANLERARACRKPLRVARCFLPNDLPCIGPKVDRQRILDWAGTAFHRATQAGISLIVFGSGGSRRRPEDRAEEAATDQFIALLRDLAPLAQAAQLVIAVEPLNPAECNFINTVHAGAAIVRELDRPEIRLLADLYHMARVGETPADLAVVTDLLAHVHIAEHQQRTAPGVMGDDFGQWFSVLRSSGYDKGISLKCGRFNIATEMEPGLCDVRHQWQQAR